MDSRRTRQKIPFRAGSLTDDLNNTCLLLTRKYIARKVKDARRKAVPKFDRNMKNEKTSSWLSVASMINLLVKVS